MERGGLGGGVRGRGGADERRSETMSLMLDK